MKLIRCLAALAPLALGTLVGGCGGLLGSVEGTGPTLPTGGGAVPAQFQVQGQAAIEGAVNARQAAHTLPNATVRVWQVTNAPGAAPTLALATMPNGQPAVTTTDANGNYSITIQVAAGGNQAAILNSLWIVEIFATGVTGPNGAASNILLLGAFVPGASGNVITRNCNGVSTLVALNLMATGQNQGTITFAGILGEENSLSATVIGANGMTFIMLATAATNADAAVTSASLQALGAQLIGVLNNAVAQVQIVLDSTGNVAAPGPALQVGAGNRINITANALKADGTAIPGVGFDFILNSGATNLFQLAPDNNGPNKAAFIVSNSAPVGSTAVVRARIACPGATTGKFVDLTITTVAHGQGHGQGSGTTF